MAARTRSGQRPFYLRREARGYAKYESKRYPRYKIHKQNHRNAGIELVYLGFPKTAFKDFLKEAEKEKKGVGPVGRHLKTSH